ncbi:MAG TPA: hypothetical protein VEH49_04540, partial [Methylomirabilota bacterium]|nr:hypothetical protein [Methylomirabilota bacterium]
MTRGLMAFAAMHIPDFSIQAVARLEPALRGAAIALVEGTPPVWKVTAANRAAFRAGVELGMTRTLAEQLGSAQIRARAPAQEKAAHAALLDFGWAISPRVEDTALDTIVLDLAGLSSLFGSDEAIAARLAHRVSLFGLTAQIAVASNLEAAIHAARGFPGITLIARGEEAKCLGCLSIRALNPSAEIFETLQLWGVATCAELAALPLPQLSERLGQEGVQLHRWARGAGARAMAPAEPRVTFEEEMELEESVGELEPLSFLLGRLLDGLCARLAARSLGVHGVSVRFHLDPCGRKDLQVRNDKSREKSESSIYEKSLTLPVPMRDSKLLLTLL